MVILLLRIPHKLKIRENTSEIEDDCIGVLDMRLGAQMAGGSKKIAEGGLNLKLLGCNIICSARHSLY